MKDYELKKIQLSDNFTIAYREAGNPAQENKILLIHGNMSSSIHYVKVMEQLAGEYHVIALDLPGMGQSSYPREFNSLLEFAEIVKDFADMIGWDIFSVVGWSTGGGIGLELAYLIPERVKALALLSSVGLQGIKVYRKDKDKRPIFSERIYLREDLAEDPFEVKPVVGLLASNNRSVMKKIWDMNIYHYSQPEESEYEAYLDGIMQQRNLVDIYVALANFNITDEDNGVVAGSGHYRNITCPIYIIHGEDDRVIPLKDLLPAKELFGDQAKLFIIKNAGHSIIQDKLEELIEIIKNNL